MSDDFIIEDMDLPLISPEESLETLSTNKFKPLFDEEKFEIRSELFRDKGLDFQIELKKLKKYTNFRFAVQLKATEKKLPNTDGSISIQILTSNINYLLNLGMPSFYVLYDSTTNTFYFENLIEFINSLSQNEKNWESQKSHVIRFSKSLIPKGLDEMYETALKRGIFQRKINEKLALHSTIVNTGDKITFDPDFNVTDDKEIREIIEAIGLVLINEGRWTEIISLHKNATGNVASSAKYNLVLGIANYYNGHYIDALSFLKAASKKENELPDDLKNHLIFFETIVKYSMGLLTQDQYNKKLKELENVEIIGLYIKLEKAKEKYIRAIKDNNSKRYEQYVKDVQDVINDPSAEKSFILFAKCELILFEGFKNNMDYVKEVSIINALEDEFGPILQIRLDAVRRFMSSNKTWYNNVQSLKNEALESKNYLALYNALTNEVKVSYQFDVYTEYVSIEKELPGYPKPEIPDKIPVFNRMLEKIQKAFEYYSHIGHIENIIIALSVKYEILHFICEYEKAEKVLNEMELIINNYDLDNHRKRYEFLKNKGTTHETFKDLVKDLLDKSKFDKEEYDIIVREMKKMDVLERNANPKIVNPHVIELFPIGHFQFPKNKIEKAFNILNIESTKTKEVFIKMVKDGIVPVANIYNKKIIKEGYLNGKLADTGIECWRNIFKIRKLFFENAFYRFERKK